jgi:branched-chain amino acid transport system substrate-binding protein
MAVGGWDGMHVIDEIAKKLGGRIEADKAVAVAKGMTIASPRGTISIDPATRDVVQDIYVRKVQKVDGAYFNVEFDKFTKVKDPGKS